MSTQSVLDEIRNEREHQLRKGYDDHHDDTQAYDFVHWDHSKPPLIEGAIAFCHAAMDNPGAHFLWPWERVGLQDFIPPESPRDALIKAATMVVAEIERMDRTKVNNEAAK